MSLFQGCREKQQVLESYILNLFLLCGVIQRGRWKSVFCTALKCGALKIKPEVGCYTWCSFTFPLQIHVVLACVVLRGSGSLLLLLSGRTRVITARTAAGF